MRRVITCPAGRKRYLSILVRYLDRLHQQRLFDALHLWVNTDVPEDREFIEQVGRQRDWAELVYRPMSSNGWGIAPFFDYCSDPDTVYIRFDDDVVFLEMAQFAHYVDFRIRHPEYFLVYANTINNVLCSHLHQRLGIVGYEAGTVAWDPHDKVGWTSGHFAELAHRSFLRAYDKGELDRYRFWLWRMYFGERLSTHVIAWLGCEFAKFDGRVDHEDDEHWLSCVRPQEAGKPNVVFGNMLAVHFAYHTQREYLDRTSLLAEYENVSRREGV